MTTLLQYLAALAEDPAAQQTFQQDPEAAIAAANLSEQDKQILRSRNTAMISATVGAQAVNAMVYAAPPPYIYAQQPPPFIYAQPPPYIYGHPQFIYAQPQFIYGQPPFIYGHAPAPFIYGHAPQQQQLQQPQQQQPVGAAFIYAGAAPAPAAFIYAPAPTKPDDPEK